MATKSTRKLARQTPGGCESGARMSTTLSARVSGNLPRKHHAKPACALCFDFDQGRMNLIWVHKKSSLLRGSPGTNEAEKTICCSRQTGGSLQTSGYDSNMRRSSSMGTPDITEASRRWRSMTWMLALCLHLAARSSCAVNKKKAYPFERHAAAQTKL